MLAEEMYRQILRVDPSNQRALKMGSLALSQTGKGSEAKEWAVRALAADPDNYQLYNNLGLIHGHLDEHEESLRCFETAIKMNGSEAFLYSNLAIQLKNKGDFEKSISVLDKALQLFPASEHLFFNYGAVVHEMAQYEQAIELYKKAIAINPELAVVHYNLSACYFLLGQWDLAWPEYEWRWKQFAQFAKVRNRFEQPYWQGEDLKGKTILLYTEQGVGDTLMTCRFVSSVKSRGGRVVLEVIAPLLDLMKSCEGADEVTSAYDGSLDYHCSLLSVPGILGIRPDTIPTQPKYLKSSLLDSPAWDLYVGLRVGICWAGNPQHPNDRHRSIPLRFFEKLAQNPDITLFGLQQDKRPHVYTGGSTIDFTEGAERVKFIDMAEFMTDFNRSAKIVENMDAVVTADTALAHLAGALGIFTCLLLPRLPDWRWGIDGENTPWYTNMRVYRNHKGWEDTLDKVAGDFLFQ